MYPLERTCRKVDGLNDVVLVLRQKTNIRIPAVTSEEWEVIPRTSIDVRRDFVVQDGIREARKKRFDPSKLLRVSFSKCACTCNT